MGVRRLADNFVAVLRKKVIFKIGIVIREHAGRQYQIRESTPNIEAKMRGINPFVIYMLNAERHGQFVQPPLSLHYRPGAFQFGQQETVPQTRESRHHPAQGIPALAQ